MTDQPGPLSSQSAEVGLSSKLAGASICTTSPLANSCKTALDTGWHGHPSLTEKERVPQQPDLGTTVAGCKRSRPQQTGSICGPTQMSVNGRP